MLMIMISDHLCIILFNRSPGFGITLAAETTAGALLCAEACSRPQRDSATDQQRESADDIGTRAACNLLAEIYRVSHSVSSSV